MFTRSLPLNRCCPTPSGASSHARHRRLGQKAGQQGPKRSKNAHGARAGAPRIGVENGGQKMNENWGAKIGIPKQRGAKK